MDVENDAQKERQRNDWLALQIERLRSEMHELTLLGDIEQRRRGLLVAMSRAGELKELERQKQESDERLAAFQSRRQHGTRKDTGFHPLDSKPDVVKRRAIVRQHMGLSTADLCKIFDFEEVPLPNGWNEKYNVRTWKLAYQEGECRRLIFKLVSVDKQKAR
jgi:hypothetical protein